ncbi:MAG TPA: Ig-like domain-containing protein, partial [Cytophagaceae bacterium]
PWWYSKSNAKGAPPYTGKSFDLVKAKARQRGKEYAQALQIHMPKITIMTTFLYGYCWDYCYGNINNLPGSEYALLPAFADGMLEALNPESILVDGNETSYYINDSKEYINGNDASYYHVRIEATPKVCDPILLGKWNQQGQVAMAPYLDYCYNRYFPNNWSNPAYQSQWMTHNIYNSLLAADQYVWTYIEGMNFWTGANAPANVDVSSDFETAVKKFRNDEALGYDMYNTGNGASQFITIPAVNITTPANNTVINAAGDITITADVNPTSSITKVEFYANSLKIGEKLTAPYSITKSFLKADYTIFARVFRTDGTHNSSSPIHLITRIVTGNYQTENSSSSIIYPNPVQSEIYLLSNGFESSDYEIISIEGKSLQTGGVNGQVISIDGLRPGTYFIKIKTDGRETVQSFVKK